MNQKDLKALRGWVRIQPSPKVETRGNIGSPDIWFVEEVTEKYVRLSYPSTGHSKNIGLNHFIGYRITSFIEAGRELKGILILKAQLKVTENEVIIEPLSSPRIALKRTR